MAWTTRVTSILASVLLAAGCRSPGAAAVPEPRPDLAEASAILEQWRTEVDAYGVQAAIRVPGYEDMFLATGVDDRDPQTPMPTTGVFPIASITKTFVAALVLQLVDEGRLTLDDTIARWLPDVAGAGRITIAMLLAHTSGLADFGNDTPAELLDLLLSDLNRRFTADEALRYSTRMGPRSEPGVAFGYSNANYQALDVITSAVTGRDLGALIDGRFTEPLGLDQTALDDGSVSRPDALHGWFALEPPTDGDVGTFDATVRRDLDFLDFPHTAVQTFAGGAGGVISSLVDLLDWGEALYSGQLLGPRLTERMLRFDNQYGSARYGLGAEGFCPCDEGSGAAGVTLVGHEGSFVGSRTLLGYAPDTGVTVVVHANVEEISTTALASIAVRLAALPVGHSG